MTKNEPLPRRPPPSGRTNLASCIVATISLIFFFLVIFIVYFTVFKPKEPKISISSVKLPSFAISNGTVKFTFSQYVAVRNPNKAAFSHYDSNLQLLYSGNQVGFMFIPAGKIEAGKTELMAATFSVQSFAVNWGVGLGSLPSIGDGVNGLRVRSDTMEIESIMKMVGRVRVLQIFSHHAEAKSGCKVAIAVNDGTVLGFHC